MERRRASTLSDAPDRKRRFRVTSGPGGWGVLDGSGRTGSGTGIFVEQGSSSRDHDNAASGMAVATGSGSGSGSGSGIGSSSATPIDLTSLSPPRRPSNDHRLSTTPWPLQGTDIMEYVRPRWQPDDEVTECPICEAPFGFFYRKHHCRKCGRVVCASCSPHRITIPRQYIVRPPDAEGGVTAAGAAGFVSARASQVIDVESNDIPAVSPSAANPALGGGEEVRLCNPCVPDPNPEPPRVFVQPNPPRHRSHQSMSVPRHPYGVLVSSRGCPCINMVYHSSNNCRVRVPVKAGGQSDRTTTHVSVLETYSAAAIKTILCALAATPNNDPCHRTQARGPLDLAAPLTNAISVPSAIVDSHPSPITATNPRAKRTSAIASRTMARGRDHPLRPSLRVKLKQATAVQRRNRRHRPSSRYAWLPSRQQRRIA